MDLYFEICENIQKCFKIKDITTGTTTFNKQTDCHNAKIFGESYCEKIDFEKWKNNFVEDCMTVLNMLEITMAMNAQ